MTDHRQAALAFLHYGGKFHGFAGDHQKAMRKRMITWLTGAANPPLYASSVSRVRDALVAASRVDVIACGIEPNVEKAVKGWAENITTKETA